MDKLQESILKVIAYFDIFNYPVTAQEIQCFMDKPCNETNLHYAINELIKEKIIFRSKEFYSLQWDDTLIQKRITANTTALQQVKRAKKIASFLHWFPYIKGIAISGSLSKKVADKKSDYDFFIITEQNRLWVSKLFFTLFIKCAKLLGLGKFFCLNYVVDESSLEVTEKNIFTATEIVTLIPVHGNELFNRFFAANEWVQDFFPNRDSFVNTATEKRYVLARKFTEWFFNNKAGDKTDDAIMHFFKRRCKKLMEQKKFTESGFQIGALMIDKHFCRPYPQHFQQMILSRHTEKITKIKGNISLAPVAL